MDLSPQLIPEVLALKPKRFGDERGYFWEAYNKRTLANFGLAVNFVQDNVSYSPLQGTLRGLHYQAPPVAQTKLISVLSGAVLDVAVDIRKQSPTFGKHVAIELSVDNGVQLLIPKGFAHGFCTLTPDTLVLYKVDAFYEPKSEFGLAWNDPNLDIKWPKLGGSVIAERDSAFPGLDRLEDHFLFDEHQS